MMVSDPAATATAAESASCSGWRVIGVLSGVYTGVRGVGGSGSVAGLPYTGVAGGHRCMYVETMRTLGIALLAGLAIWVPAAEARPKLTLKEARQAMHKVGQADVASGAAWEYRVNRCRRLSRMRFQCNLWEHYPIENGEAEMEFLFRVRERDGKVRARYWDIADDWVH